MGDIKLMGVLGAFCGWQGALFSIFGGALIASCIILSYRFIKRLYFKNSVIFNKHIPFGFCALQTQVNLKERKKRKEGNM
jgi:leader peptidase (prepilin peptidase)/N-methyltransferase